jgi:hypothetical protein
MTLSTEKSPEKSASNRNSKTSRKQAKALQLLAKDYGIGEHSGDSACANIMVCNAGLVTGCSQADLLGMFGKFGPVQQLLLLPRKSYSFVVFCHAEDAQVTSNFVIYCSFGIKIFNSSFEIP